MKKINEEKSSFNLIHFSIIYCLFSIFILLITDLWYIRIISLFFFFFFLGYPFSLFIKNLDTFERILVSFGLSQLFLLIIYYSYYMSAYIFNVVPTFEFHILLIGISSVSLNFLILIYLKDSNPTGLNVSFQKIKNFIFEYKFLFLILAIGSVMRFLFLDFPDLTTDETFFVSSSYPIIDPFNVMGIPPPPFTYLSSHHPPLNIVGTNLVLNIINPFDWLSMKDWMGKFFPVFIGSISIFAIFSLLNRVYGRNSGYVGAFFYAVNNYAIIISRIAYQEIFLILFLIIIMEFAYREKWNLVGVFLGLSLLTKFTALTIIPSLLIYFCIRNLRLNQKSMKTFFKKFIYATFLALLLFLPILIANITTYYNFGYADTFWSRVFGLRDPMTEAYGEAEMPIGLIPTGVLTYDPLISGQLINVIGPILIPFITLCVILSFLDKPKKLGFIIFIYSFYLIFYLIFTSRWFQVVSLSPIIIPITIISCRIVNLDKLFSKFNIFLNKSYPHIPLKIKSFIRRVEKYTIKFRVPKTFSYKYIKTNYKTHKVKHQHFIICSFLITILSFSFIYSFNTLYKPHYFLDYKFDDVTETLKTNFEYSTLGYLWIMNVGYDEVMEIVRLFRFSNVYVDDTHPVFSYLYYFYTRGFTALVSDWDNRTNSLFIFYKSPNYFWEPFARSNKGDANEDYIKLNGDRIWNSLNFEIYVI